MANNNTYKMTKLVGESPDSIEEAVRTAIANSGVKVQGPSWAQISELRASLGTDSTVEAWQVVVEVASKVD